MIVVPTQFAEQLVTYEGPRASTWLTGVPALAAEFADRWHLTPDGPLTHGFVGLVLPMRTADNTPAVLKLTLVTAETRDEPTALAAWRGAGAVRLLDSDPERGVLLLERLDATRTLADAPIGDAVRIISGLLRRLAIPAPPGLGRDLRDEAERWITELPRDWRRLGEPFPRRLLDAAVDACAQWGPSAARLLVNEDLHYANVLGGAREPWLVIDPKPLVGDPEFTTLSLLWNRRAESSLDDRFAAIVDGARLDPERARGWTLVRAVRNWLDFVAVGDLEDDGCRAVRDIAPWALH
ncbi:aminoglycoside phosphotransferase [Nocardia brasiliensis]|uniref:Aminoglycoside phosphotransferase n=1 Tax=Nocardia brasiliensis TaxID=37326 RepID=A0A6G9XM69_NOCBR|nr:aminoglycoside phosphotransferase family protein [Nocardia brasiliensis]QIS02032.1 aminoglycoside phosphotransferase [Nocardia brasiliensis]